MADPVPLAAQGVSHDALLNTPHAQLASVVTVTLPVPAAAPTDCDDEFNVYEHVCPAAACVTVCDCPLIVMVPVRALADVLAATEYCTVADPVPLAAQGVSHDALLDTPHPQLAAVVTVTLPVPPAAPIDCDAAFNEYEHVCAAAACVTVCSCPPIVMVPVRALADVLAATEYCTVADPVPLAAQGVSHDALLNAPHAQLASVVTVTLPVPPAAPTDCDDEFNVYEHVCTAAACVTVCGCPLIVMVPVRALAEVLAATEYCSVADPVPLAAQGVSHDALLDTPHPQLAAVVTVTLPVPPAAPIDCDAAFNEYEHVCAPAACVTVCSCPPIVMVPVRALAEVLAATSTCSVADPVPLAAQGVSHDALLNTPHAQLASVVTVTLPVPAAAPTDCDDEFNVYEQVCAPAACVTVCGCPLIVMVPVRALPDVLAATEYCSVADPVPLAAQGVSHDALLDTPHPQLAAVVTVTLPVPPAAPIDCDAAFNEYEHVCAAAACVTVCGCPPIVMVPVRALADVLAATGTARWPTPFRSRPRA